LIENRESTHNFIADGIYVRQRSPERRYELLKSGEIPKPRAPATKKALFKRKPVKAPSKDWFNVPSFVERDLADKTDYKPLPE
jgi:hypothetical protein